MPPPRPPSVPEKAVWAGGEDGGAWIDCSLDTEKNADFCTVYSDRSGEIRARTHFVLKGSGVGISEAELSYLGFDGLRIYLKEGRYLVPLRYYRGEKLHLAPVEALPEES